MLPPWACSFNDVCSHRTPAPTNSLSTTEQSVQDQDTSLVPHPLYRNTITVRRGDTLLTGLSTPALTTTSSSQGTTAILSLDLCIYTGIPHLTFLAGQLHSKNGLMQRFIWVQLHACRSLVCERVSSSIWFETHFEHSCDTNCKGFTGYLQTALRTCKGQLSSTENFFTSVFERLENLAKSRDPTPRESVRTHGGLGPLWQVFALIVSCCLNSLVKPDEPQASTSATGSATTGV